MLTAGQVVPVIERAEIWPDNCGCEMYFPESLQRLGEKRMEFQSRRG